ncbi:MAG: hypothetical protein AUK43_05805 [Oscillatoriales cyanobacterium CG2_30_40_61]|nr:MAG: hypothetical protein AUK43_05805 [Oscillatoriales cyanobacterium CG2_30_40_61]
MNVHKSQIQALITEIDEVLSQPNLRLPWVVFGETVTRSRQVLERVRKYLIFLTEQADEQAPLSPMETNQPSISPGTREPLWQAIRREMIYLRSHLTQPLQDEIDHLRTEQRNLIQEIQQLEARKAQALGQVPPSPYQQQISREFLQEFMTRLQDSLIHNVTETLNHIETRFLDSVLLTETPSLPPSERFDTPPASLSNLTPAQRLEQMRQLQAESDHLLITLDSSLSVIFEALQRNLQTYSDSLGQSLERMHSLGKQGEVMFTTLINQLAQQVGQETSSYLQSSLQLTESESETPSPTVDLPSPESVVSSPGDFSSAFEGFFPYAGAEVPQQRNSTIPGDRDIEEEQEFKITAQFEVESDEKLSLSSVARIEDQLDIMTEGSLSLDWDDSEQSLVEPSTPDSELESLFDQPTQTESPGMVRTPTPDGDLFGDDFDLIQVLDHDISNQIQESATVENHTEVDLDPEDLFADLEIETTKIEALEPENLNTESLDETAGFLSLNSLDIFGQPEQNVPIESDFSLTADVLDPVSLESENLFTPEVELVSPLIDEITDSSFADTANSLEETLADLSDVFEEPTFEEVPSVNSGVVSARTQQELTGIASPLVSSPDPIQNKTVNLEKDIYIQASPDENLLPIDFSDDSQEVDSRLLIDRNTLEHLEADLFNLEQPETPAIPKQTSLKSTPAQPQFPRQNSPTKPVIKVAQPEETITFEDLFRDMGMELSSDQSVPSISVESQNQPSAAKQNTSTTGLSDLTLDDVFNTFNLAEEESRNWDNEQEGDSLNLEALSQEFLKN